MTDNRSYDLVLFGATGFTGELTAEYLARNAPVNTRWALAGRSQSKLEQVRTRLAAINPACAKLPLLLADVSDPDSLKKVAESAKVAITTVGPYIHYGEPLVAACAAAGTHYVDLTGEPEFVDLMWLRHHETAQKSGAKIVHCCGFDSIPHDLGAYFTVQQLPQGTPITMEGFVRAGGGFSGGTFHSAVNAFSRARLYARTRKERVAREGRATRRIGDSGNGIRFHKPLGTWVVPMPTIDPQIIKRSARALDIYGPEFRYSHFVQMKSLPQVVGLIGGVGALFALAQLKPTRNWLLSKKNPGEGPSEAQRKKSWFRVRFYGEAGGKKVVTEVTGGDPGYGETSKMLAESGMCLAFDALSAGGGQMTPAQAMAVPLMARLMKAGIKFEVVEKT